MGLFEKDEGDVIRMREFAIEITQPCEVQHLPRIHLKHQQQRAKTKPYLTSFNCNFKDNNLPSSAQSSLFHASSWLFVLTVEGENRVWAVGVHCVGLVIPRNQRSSGLPSSLALRSFSQ